MTEQHANLLQAILLELFQPTRPGGVRHGFYIAVFPVSNTKAQDWARGGGVGTGAEPADEGAAPQPKPTGGAPGTAAALDAALDSLSAEDLNVLIEKAPALMRAVAEAVGRPLAALRRASLWVSVAADAFGAVTSHSDQTKRAIADAMLAEPPSDQPGLAAEMRALSEDVLDLRGDLLEVTGLLREARLARDFSVRNAAASLGQPSQ